MIYLLVVIAVIIGTMMPFQAAINAQLTRSIEHPFFAAFISFFTGSIVLGSIVLIQGNASDTIKRLTTVSPHLFIGGALGALFVGSSIYFIPRMGATTMIASMVTGQLVMSVIMDHYGWVGLQSNEVTTTRIIGVLLLFVGIFLVMRKA